MRKADYALLAAIIACEIKSAEQNATSGIFRLETLARIAENFASLASVNEAEFLKACGLE